MEELEARVAALEAVTPRVAALEVYTETLDSELSGIRRLAAIEDRIARLERTSVDTVGKLDLVVAKLDRIMTHLGIE